MNRAAIIFAAATAFLAPNTAFAGQITHHTFQSGTLGADYPYNIYVPDGYETGNLSYPVLYLLHGSFENENTWANKGGLRAAADALIEAGDIPPAIVVMPGNKSWWVDGYNEKAQTAFFDDLIPEIERSWRVLAKREGRVIAGLSAGGYGTVNFILQHPDMFAAAAALSPAIYADQPPENSSANRHPAYLKEDGSYDPQKWTDLNFTKYVDGYLAQDTVVPIFLFSGNNDRFNISMHAAQFYETMRAHQPNYAELRIVDGDHVWPLWKAVLPEAMTFVFTYASWPEAEIPAATAVAN